ncbi:MAG TPA: hypothetical protein VMF64_17955 [Steroidobacteraceae bacterium]|jgi:hypothetical protein|nr:hypothetical protein [Steroidobacteraceae bacterium]
MVRTLDQASCSGRLEHSDWQLRPVSAEFRLPDHDLHQGIAEESLEIFARLWDSGEPGAIVANRNGKGAHVS